MLVRILYYYFKTRYLHKKINTIEKLKAHQEKQFKRLVKHTLPQSSFYKPYLNKPFNEWPIINKKIMMEHFDEINTAKIKKSEALAVALKAENTRDFSPLIQQIAVGLSSGTSGHRGLFLANNQERDLWVGMILAKAMPHGIYKTERIAFFLRANNALYKTLNKSHKIQFHFFDLLDDFETHIERLNQLNPTLLSAPASVLLMLAKQKGRLLIRPQKIFSVAEVLEPEEEHLLSHTFGCPISQIYQCTEGLLAISDRKTNALLMNEEFLIIEKEWIDEHRFVPIITDLFRTTQPIIRYRLDDILVTKSSHHPLTQLTAIEGRIGDTCYGKKGNHHIPIFADLLRQAMVSSPVEFDDYVISQRTLSEFTIQITPDTPYKHELIHHLNKIFIHKQCETPLWHWEPYQKNALGAKRRRIMSFVK